MNVPWRPLDDISVQFQAPESSASDNRVIEFSTWCEGEYCEPVRVTQTRAAQLMTSLAHALKQSKDPALFGVARRMRAVRPSSRLIWIESRWMDCHLVYVEPPESYKADAADDPHAFGYSMQYANRREALKCALRECVQWLLWCSENDALDVGQQVAELASRFVREARSSVP